MMCVPFSVDLLMCVPVASGVFGVILTCGTLGVFTVSCEASEPSEVPSSETAAINTDVPTRLFSDAPLRSGLSRLLMVSSSILLKLSVKDRQMEFSAGLDIGRFCEFGRRTMACDSSVHVE